MLRNIRLYIISTILIRKTCLRPRHVGINKAGSNPLNSIHKTPLHLIKYHYPHSEQHHHKTEAIAEHGPAESAYAQSAVFECFHDGGDGINHHSQADFLIGDGAERVDNGRGIHPELHHKGKEDCHIAVLGSHG